MPDLETLVTDVFWKPDHPVNTILDLASATKADIRTAILANRPRLEIAGYLEPDLETLRFYADSGHGWKFRRLTLPSLASFLASTVMLTLTMAEHTWKRIAMHRHI